MALTQKQRIANRRKLGWLARHGWINRKQFEEAIKLLKQ